MKWKLKALPSGIYKKNQYVIKIIPNSFNLGETNVLVLPCMLGKRVPVHTMQVYGNVKA